MAQYRIYDRTEDLNCPYCGCIVMAQRFQYHLIKCRKNYKGPVFKICPFNATHHMPKPELRHHLAICPDKVMLEQELKHAARKENGELNMFKGCTDTPVYKELDIPVNEDWDAEVAAPVQVRSHYVVSIIYEPGQFRDLSEEEPNAELPYGTEEEMVRLPKTSSKAAVTSKLQGKPIQQPVSSVYAYSIGRGVGDRRNNAGLSGHENAEACVPVMPYGRGRGRWNKSAGAVGHGSGMATGCVGCENVSSSGFCIPKTGNSNPSGTDQTD